MKLKKQFGNGEGTMANTLKSISADALVAAGYTRVAGRNDLVRATRFEGLGYRRVGLLDWRFVDMETGETIGMIYPSGAELLADVDRFAKERGF